MLDFTVSGSSLTVTANGEVLSPYDLYTQVPRYTLTASNISFLLPDGRVFNSIPYNGISVGGITFSGTQNQLQTLLISTFTVSSDVAANTAATVTNANAIGTLSSLTTTAKNNLVEAINEVNAKPAGSSFPTQQSHTSGTTVTVTSQTTDIWLLINPASTLATLSITTPATPVDGQKLEISFGGTMTTGTVVTSLTVTANTSQTILQASSPTSVLAGETISYRFKSSNSVWYRII